MKKKKCPSCAIEIPENAKVCPICGYEFPESNKIFSIIIILTIILAMLYLLI